MEYVRAIFSALGRFVWQHCIPLFVTGWVTVGAIVSAMRHQGAIPGLTGGQLAILVVCVPVCVGVALVPIACLVLMWWDSFDRAKHTHIRGTNSIGKR